MGERLKPEHEDFFRYTGGRWLWQEEARLQRRYKSFNVEELKKVASQVVGGKACVSMTKLGEGGYNKVFRLAMDNGSIVIARIPNPIVAPYFKTTASEVATMEFARTILDIPVPRVLSWSGTADNSIQSEYIMMQEAPGTRLTDVWCDMEINSKARIVAGIVDIEKKLSSLSFTRYGSLYFADDAFPGCEKAEVTGHDVPELKKKAIGSRFVIGPVTSEEFWMKERATLDIDRGPCELPITCTRTIFTLLKISKYAASKLSNDVFEETKSQKDSDAHIALYKKFLDVADCILPSNPELLKPTLWHWDLHSPNIFVDGENITCLIDWQYVWVGPLFLQARHPKLVEYKGPIMFHIPDEYKEVEDEEELAYVKKQVEKSLLLRRYELITKQNNPVLHEIFQTPQGRTIHETLEFSTNTWDGDILPFRECLIRIERDWDEINDSIPCPIAFTDEERAVHHREGEGWNEKADFWDDLAGFVHRDGWTSHEDYDKALEMFAELRVRGLQMYVGEERSNFEKRTRWAVKPDSGASRNAHVEED